MKYSFYKETLENGLDVIVEPRPKRGVIAINLRLNVGVIYQNPGQRGMVHLLEHLCMNGSENYPGRREAPFKILEKGGHINGSVGKDYCKFYGEVAKEYVNEAMDVITDVSFRSNLDDLEKEKQVVIQEERKYEDDVSRLSYRNLLKMMYKDVRMFRGEREDAFRKITKEDVRRFYKKHFNPNNATISIVGPVKKEEVINKLAEKTKDLEKRKKPEREALKPKEGPKVKLVEKDVKVGYVSMGIVLPGMKASSDEYWDLLLVNKILSSVRGSLFENLRWKKGLVYSSSSYLRMFKEIGHLTMHFACDPGKIDQCVKSVKGILGDFGEKRRRDLESFKTEFVGKRRRFRDEVVWEAGHLSGLNSAGALEYANKYEEQILGVTPKRIMSTARKYLNPKDFYVSIVK